MSSRPFEAPDPEVECILREHEAREKRRRRGPECSRCGKDSCDGTCAKVDNLREAGRIFAPISVANLYDRTSDEVVWLWHRMIPAGALVLLAAFMKAGKTTLAYALLAALLRGGPFLDRETRQTRVLLLALEENLRDVKRKLLKFGVNREAGLFVQSRPVPTAPSECAAVVEFIRERDIGLVVVDTLARCWPVWGVDNENDNARVAAALAPLLEICRDLNVTVLLLHHTGKLVEGFGREVRGAGAILALADQALLFDRYRAGDPCDRIIRVLGRYDESPAETIVRYDKAAGTYAVLGEEQADEGGPRS
jgi:KaiC/GvpD/RAD55 family RecA-like ATPase